jgi:hypothetical protein
MNFDFNTVILLGLLTVNLFWVIRTIKKDRKKKRDQDDNDIKVSI